MENPSPATAVTTDYHRLPPVIRVTTTITDSIAITRLLRSPHEKSKRPLSWHRRVQHSGSILCYSKILAKKLPELLDFDKDLGHLEAASKIQLKSLAEEMQAVSKGLEKVEQELTVSENDGAISAGF
ncbi:hypothetical protein RHGRI_003571 [Rhododendron griersonianum]|uniref:FH2 domain-containing protein n=1 Tax=Rhododendron griersonianum TaxID=479676 RepID=A0AAV6L855_9ERIC|nr:hypothetical protein RHGRI_003571 [Rhododendron griersonianum]